MASQNEKDIEADWKDLLEEFSGKFQPIAGRFGESNARFTPENSWISVDDPDTVNETCHDIRNPYYNGRFFGCTTQDGWSGNLDLPYEKPISETYIANNWSPWFVRNVENHELSHQAIISVRQMLEKDYQKRNANGQTRLNDVRFQEIKNDLDMLDTYMDLWEKARYNSITGEVQMNGQFDVYPKLKLIVDKYFNWLNGG